MIWSGNGNGSWDTNGTLNNWKNGQVFADNQGAVFDDSASSAVVNVATNVAPEGYPSYTITNTDGLTFTNITVFTNQPNFYPGIIVSNATKNYVITGSGRIRGITGIYKTGPGTVTLMTSNDFNGNVIIDNGVVAVTNLGANLNVMSLGVAGGGQMKNEVILDGGTLSYVGTTNVQLGHNIVINPGSGTITVASSTNSLTVNNNIVGTGSLTLPGPGTLQMNSTVNNYPGGTFVNGGALRLTAAALGVGGLTLSSGTALVLTNNLTLTNTINMTGVGASLQIIGASTNILSGNWTGNGSVTISNANPLTFAGDLSQFGGTISFGASTGTFQFNTATNKNPCLGSAAATFDLGTGSALLQDLNGSNLVYNLGALSGGANTVLSGRGTNSASPPGTTYSIGANGLSTTFSGRITNGLAYNGTGPDVVSVTKVGTGTLLLNGANGYTGPTTVSSGALGGAGSITSPLTVTASGTLMPGAATVGTFTVNNNVTLGGTVLMRLNSAGSPAVNDELAVSGTLTGGGTLTVTNVGPDLVNGTKFTLFSKPVTGFTSVTLPAHNPANTSAYTWNNTLATDGSITLVSGGTTGVNTNPTNIVFSASGGTLTLSWPADHTGWRLEVQTNPLTMGLNTNWFTVPNSTTVNSVSIPMDVTRGSIFYRLVYP
jgi:autotransporter-associated beta strand protein